MYSYKLLANGDIETRTNGDTSDGFITFPDEPIVDWTKRRFVNGKLEDIPQPEPPKPYVPTPEEIKQQLLQQLDWEYQPQFLELSRAWADATMEGKTELANSIAADRLALKQEYEQKRGEING